MIMKTCKYLPNPDYKEDWIPAKFYGIYQHSKIVPPNPMVGGYSGGTITFPVAVVEDSDGFAKTILTLNKNSKELNALVFYASIYTSNIYSYINNEKSSLSEIYADLNNLMFIYKEIERKGYKTGNLSSENLVYLNNFIEDKITSYYKNLGILKALEKSEKDEQK